MRRDVATAARAVEAAMAERGWSVRDLAGAADVDTGTVSDFLSGVRWPRAATRGRFERALGWETGRIRAIAEGVTPAPAGETARRVSSVVEAIEADASLLPEAKEHFLNQYRLLLRVQAEEQAAQRAVGGPLPAGLAATIADIESRDLSRDAKDRLIAAAVRRLGGSEVPEGRAEEFRQADG